MSAAQQLDIRLSTVRTKLASIYTLANGSNLGIGDSNPQATLSVGGTFNVSSNASIQGDLNVLGNVYVGGDTLTVNVQTVNIEDNILTINSGLASNQSPPSTLLSGIEVNRGSQPKYQFVFEEASQLFKVGTSGGLQAVATRADAVADRTVAFWDGANSQLGNDASFSFDRNGNLNLGAAGTTAPARLAVTTSSTSSNAAAFLNPALGGQSNVMLLMGRDATSTLEGGYVGFQRMSPGSTDNRMRLGLQGGQGEVSISGLGNLGVGVDKPVARLHVAGQAIQLNAQASNAVGQTTKVIISSGGTSDAQPTTLELGIVGSGAVAGNVPTIASKTVTGVAAAPLAFAVSNVEAMRITGAGLVGIGTSAPSQALEVVGSIKATGGQLISTVPVGTAPLQVSSSTLVNNLNAQLLNGQTGAYYTTTSNLQGIVTVAQGGTGNNTLSTNKVLVGNGTGAVLQPSNLHWDNASSYLGVGTSTPAAPLHAGTANPTTNNSIVTACNILFSPYNSARHIVLYDNSGNENQFFGIGVLNSAQTYNITTNNSTNSHVFQAGSSATSSQELMRIRGDGRVGIGNASPAYTLDVNGTFNASGTASFVGGAKVQAFNSGSWIDIPTTGSSGLGSGGPGANAWIAYASSTNAWFAGAAPGDVAYRNTAGRLLFGTDSTTPAMTLAVNKYLGIGTTAPSAPLHVGSSNASGISIQALNGITTAGQLISTVATGTAPLSVTSTTLVTNLNAQYLNGQLGSYYTTTSNLQGIVTVPQGGTGNSALTNNKVLVGNGTGAVLQPTSLHWDSANNYLGIGTASPTAPLHVSTAAANNNSIVTACNIQIANYQSNSKIVLFDGFGNEFQHYGFGIGPATMTYTIQANTSAFQHVFQAGSNSTSAQELMRIRGDGNVGIGTSNPAYTLDVNGTGRFTGQLTSTLATGTAPFSVTSTTLVSNLNAQYLNGQLGSYYTNIANQTGTASVVQGGTGTNTLAASKVLVGNGTGAVLQPALLHWDGTNTRLGVGTSNPAQALDVSGGINVSGQLTSTVASGTAPFAVTSTTMVANLNADQLDGQDGTYYSSASNLTGIVDVTRGGTGASTLAANKVLVGNSNGVMLQPANLHWDNTNSRLGVGTSTPAQAIDVSGSIAATSQLISTVANGTAPLVVTSSNLVANLNVQYLGGQPGSYYTNIANLTGTASVAQGGTGNSTLTASKVLVGNGTGAVLQPTLLHWDNTNSRLGVGTSAPGQAVDVTGSVRASSQLVSTVATGTAPLSVASTTLVTNLNSQYLNGQLGTYYTNIANLTGTATVAQGGTGNSTLTASKVLVGNGTGAVLQPTNLHWDNTNSRLGLGTSTPAQALDVAGGINVSGQLTSTVATGTAPFAVTSTTMVANLNADLLDGQSGAFYSSASNLTGIVDVTRGGTGANTLSANKILVGNSNGVVLQPTSLHWDNTNSRLGVGTSAPGQAVDVTGSVRASSQLISTAATGTAPLSVASTTLVNNLNAQYLNGQLGSYYTNIANLTGTATVAQGGTGNSTLTSSKVLVGNGTGAVLQPTLLHWDNTNSYFGIGTSAPSAPLHVGTASATTNNSIVSACNIQFNNYLSNRHIVLYDNNATGNENQFFGIGVVGNTQTYSIEANTSAQSHVFRAGINSTSSQELMRITGAGNVGIGTASPTAQVHVNASIGAADPDSGHVYCYNPSTAANQHAIMGVRVNGSNSGNPYISMDVAGVTGWSMGTDNTGGTRNFAIRSSWNFSTANVLSVTSAGYLMLPSTGPSGYGFGTTGACLGYAASGTQYAQAAQAGDLVLRASTGNNLHLLVNPATTAICITSNNYVGIGNTAPTQALDVNGTARFQSGTILNNNSYLSWPNSAGTTTVPIFGVRSDNAVMLNTVSGGASLYINANGNVPTEINYGNTSYTNIYGGLRLTGYDAQLASASNSIYTSGNILFTQYISNRHIVLSDTGGNENQFYGIGIQNSTQTYTIATNNPQTSHVFQAGSSATTSQELMRIRGDGTVGIGTASPGARLHVAGSEATSSGATAALVVQNTATNGGTWYLRAGATGTSTPAGGFSIANAGAYFLTIDPRGYIGIGGNNTAPAYPLDVLGDARVTQAVIGRLMRVQCYNFDNSAAYNWGPQFNTDASGKTYAYLSYEDYGANASSGWYFAQNNAKRYFIRYDGAASQLSDKRLKNEIGPLESALDKVCQLRGLHYAWKEDASQMTNAGFFAQEVQQVIPEAVSEQKDENKTLMLNTTTIIPYLVEAVKEQQVQITDLQNENKDLKQQLTDLASKFSMLEAAVAQLQQQQKQA